MRRTERDLQEAFRKIEEVHVRLNAILERMDSAERTTSWIESAVRTQPDIAERIESLREAVEIVGEQVAIREREHRALEERVGRMEVATSADQIRLREHLRWHGEKVEEDEPKTAALDTMLEIANKAFGEAGVEEIVAGEGEPVSPLAELTARQMSEKFTTPTAAVEDPAWWLRKSLQINEAMAARKEEALALSRKIEREQAIKMEVESFAGEVYAIVADALGWTREYRATDPQPPRPATDALVAVRELVRAYKADLQRRQWENEVANQRNVEQAAKLMALDKENDKLRDGIQEERYKLNLALEKTNTLIDDNKRLREELERERACRPVERGIRHGDQAPTTDRPTEPGAYIAQPLGVAPQAIEVGEFRGCGPGQQGGPIFRFRRAGEKHWLTMDAFPTGTLFLGPIVLREKP